MANFHFCRDTPPESFYTDIQLLNKFNDEQFHELINTVITFLVDPLKSTWLMEQLENFAQQYGVAISSLKNVVKTLLSVLKNALRKNLEASLIGEDLILLGLSEEKTSFSTQQWELHQTSMARGTLAQTLMVNQLVDMEWKFGVTAASSELNKVGSTFLSLKLVIDKGHKTENVYMALYLQMLGSIFHLVAMPSGFAMKEWTERAEFAPVLFILARNGESKSKYGISKLTNTTSLFQSRPRIKSNKQSAAAEITAVLRKPLDS